jgi:hypothetical protein
MYLHWLMQSKFDPRSAIEFAASVYFFKVITDQTYFTHKILKINDYY